MRAQHVLDRYRQTSQRSDWLASAAALVDLLGLAHRAIRLGSAWLDVATAFRRIRHATTDEQDVTESFEVQLIERPPDRR